MNGANQLVYKNRDEQRALGMTDFMSKLSDAGKEYYKTTVSLIFHPMFRKP